MTEQIEVRFAAGNAQEAVELAKAWARAEGFRVRTIARVKQATFDGVPVSAWLVTLAVSKG